MWPKPSLAADDELARLDATGQADLVRRGEVSPTELVEAAVRRAEALDPQLHAFVATWFDEALEWAGGVDRDAPFAGVPTVYKDLGASEAGMANYQGNRVLREIDHRTAATTITASRIRAAGLVPLGKSSTPEFGGQPTTQPIAFGPTRNPWDLERSTSGSSGGSAALAAAGVVPIAHGTDGYGSIRDPASWCGLVGLKVSRGRLPIGTATGHTSVEGGLCRSVRDSARLLDALTAGGVPEVERWRAPTPERRYADEVGAPVERLRVGVLTTVEAPQLTIDPQCAAAAEAAGRLLESLGHTVDAAGPAGLVDEQAVANQTLVRSCRGAIHGIRTALGRDYTEDEVEPYTWAASQVGRRCTARELVVAAEWQQAWTARIVVWWDEFDLLVTPATGRAPMLLEELAPPPEDPASIAPTFHSIRCFAAPFNITGQPAISLPLGTTENGLPIGVQLVAAPFREDLLLRVAAHLEALQTGYRDRSAP